MTYRTLRRSSASRHFGIKTLWDTSAPISRHFDTKNVVGLRDTSTRVPWSRKSRDTSIAQDNSDETQLHRWFVWNFGTHFVVPKCLGAEVSCGRSVRLPYTLQPMAGKLYVTVLRCLHGNAPSYLVDVDNATSSAVANTKSRTQVGWVRLLARLYSF